MNLRITFVLLAAFVPHCAAQQGAFRQMSLKDLRDRIEGGWAGQMIGVSYGAPTEFRLQRQDHRRRSEPWTPDRVSNSLDQDDLYVDMTFAKVLDDKGLDATTADFGAMFRDAKYALWHANLAARRALQARRARPTLSGTPKYNAHANDIDFQIESDFIGLMAPGLHQRRQRHRPARRPRHELRRRHLSAACSCPACTRRPSSKATRARWSKRGWPPFRPRAPTRC